MLRNMSENHQKSSLELTHGSSASEDNESDRPDGEALSLPFFVAGSGALDRLVDTARDYARAAASDNTLKAYAKGWAQFARWCRMKGADPLPPTPQLIWRRRRAATPRSRSSRLNGGCRGLCGIKRSAALCWTAVIGISPRFFRDPAQTRAPASAERGNPARGYSRDDRHPAPRPARAARPGDAADRLCGRPAAVRTRQPRSRPR